MAAYVTQEELSHLSVGAGALHGIPSWDIDKALEAASRVADSYLTIPFMLPLTAWGDDLKQAVADIAAYRVLKARGFDPQKGDAETLRDAFRDAMKWLVDVSTGKAIPTGVVDSSPSGTNNTDDAGEAVYRPKVVSISNDSATNGGFWGKDGMVTGGVGTPRRRGW